MKKTIVRLLIIVVVVLAVAGGVYWAGENLPVLQGISGEHGEGFGEERLRPGMGEGFELEDGRPERNARPEGRFPGLDGEFGEREGHAEGSASGLLGVLRNVGIFVVFVLAVLGLGQVFQIAKRFLAKRKPPTPTAENL